MLAIRDLAFRYPGKAQAALDGISLHAQRGEILGLLGPNGAGKTTLIAHLTGLLPIQQGEIRIDAESLQTARRQAPTRIGLAPQEYAFYPSLSVRENLSCFAAVAGLRGAALSARVNACCALTRLEDFLDTRATQLSGGLKRRLNLAIALLPEPELLLLDEPTVGVDPQSRAFILDVVRNLARGGTAVIYTSHYMDEIESIADRVVIIDHGKVLREGSLHTLLASGSPQMQLRVMGELLPDAAAQLGALCTLTRAEREWTLALHENVSPAQVLAVIDAAGIQVQQISYGRYDLEQLFMSLTHRSLRDH